MENLQFQGDSEQSQTAVEDNNKVDAYQSEDIKPLNEEIVDSENKTYVVNNLRNLLCIPIVF